MIEEAKKLTKQFKNFSIDRTLKRLKKSHANFQLYKGTEVNQIIFGQNEYYFKTDKNNFPATSLFLFNLVKKDVMAFLENVSEIKLPEQRQTTFYNIDFDDEIGVITGTDLNHAYWRIAYLKGYISENTYTKGLRNDDSKQVRLATLGVLGRKKEYDVYENGEYVRTIIRTPENPLAKMVYKDIRFTCYNMMYELSQILGDDFESWNVDCIYYRDSKKTRKIVHEYFDQQSMLYKQLVF